MCKKCLKVYRVEAENNNFICAGIAKRGTKHKQDTVWLCLNGELAETYLEMTPNEATHIITGLVKAVA